MLFHQFFVESGLGTILIVAIVVWLIMSCLSWFGWIGTSGPRNLGRSLLRFIFILAVLYQFLVR